MYLLKSLNFVPALVSGDCHFCFLLAANWALLITKKLCTISAAAKTPTNTANASGGDTRFVSIP